MTGESREGGFSTAAAWMGPLLVSIAGGCLLLFLSASAGEAGGGIRLGAGTVLPLLLLVLSVAVALIALRRAGATRKLRAIVPTTLLAVAFVAAALGVSILFGRSGTDGTGERAEAASQRRAADVLERWNGVLDSIDAASRVHPSILTRVAVGPIDDAFRELSDWSTSRPILGSPAAIAVFSREDRPLAWWGPLTDLGPLPVPGSGVLYLHTGTGNVLVLQRPVMEGPLGYVRIEVLLASHLRPEPGPLGEALGLDSGEEGDRIRFADDIEEGTGVVSETIGTAKAPYWTGSARGTSGERRRLVVPLRDRDGALIAAVELYPASPASLAAGNDRVRALLVLLGVVMAAVAGVLLAGGPGGGLSSGPRYGFILLLPLLAAVRIGLGAVMRTWFSPDRLTGAELFAMPAPLGLLASPADLFLTAALLYAAVKLLLAALPPSMLRARGVPLAVAGLLCAAFSLSLVFLLPGVSRISPMRFQLLTPTSPRLALQASAVLLVLAPVEIFFAGLLRGPRWRFPLRRGALIVTIAALASGGALLAGGARASRQIVERDLAPELGVEAERRERALGEVLAHAPGTVSWASLRDHDEGRPSSSLAYDVWTGTKLAVDGLASAVTVLDAEGRLRSEFVTNLPTGVHLSSPSDPPTDPGTMIRPDSYNLLTLRIPLLRGETPLRDDGEIVGRLIVQVSSEPDNVPFLKRNDPLVGGLARGGRDPVYDEFLGGEPLLILYQPGGEVLYSSSLRPPALTAKFQIKLSGAGSIWRDVEVGGRTFRLFYFAHGEDIAAIGYPDGGWGEKTSSLVRFVVLALAGWLLLRSLLALIASPIRAMRTATTGWIGQLRSSYSRRLLAVLLLASMVPLLGLSAFLRTQVLERTRSGIETAGISALESARRLLEDYLYALYTPPEPDARAVPEDSEIGDDALFWLSRVVRQDLAVFVDGRLVAASRPDLYASGVLLPTLDGDVARRVLHRREPYTLKEQTLGSEKVFFIYAPISLPVRSETGVLALPLAASQREQRREADVVGEGLLTATALLGVLLGAIAFATSRKISGPIRELTAAASRVAEGDYDVRVPVRTIDETGQMVGAFNRMASALEGQREDLRRRGDYIEKILLNATTGVISTDPHGLVRTINPAARLLLDLPEDPVGDSLPRILSAEPRLGRVAGLIAGSLAGAAEKFEREIDLPSGGQDRRLRFVVLPLREEGGEGTGRIILLEDLTEIVRSNRLAAWAEMARRIAHEIKNPLTPIQLSAEHLLRVRRSADPGFDPVLQECVRTILSQVRNLREISAEFSAYSRLPALRLERADPAAIVKEVLAAYRNAPPRGIAIEEDYAPCPGLPIDARVLRQAIVNLVENALQAMPEGGTLRVAAGPGAPGEVTISIADTGEGMDEQTLARIFEPYFSTRDTGTGLGMPIARRAVEEHGGTLTATSRPGGGTVMTITLKETR